MTGKLFSIIKITSGYHPIYLYVNTKKPYWKKKPIFIIPKHWSETYDFLYEKINVSKIYFRETEKGKLFPLDQYEHWVGK
jgi:hypothetical protein